MSLGGEMRKLILFLLVIFAATEPVQARNVRAKGLDLDLPASPLVVVGGAGMVGLGIYALLGMNWRKEVANILAWPDDRILSQNLTDFYFCKWRATNMVVGGYWPTAYDLSCAGWQKVLPALFRDLEGPGAQAFMIQNRTSALLFTPKYEAVPADKRAICTGHVPTLATLKELEWALLREMQELRGYLDKYSRMKCDLVRAMRTVNSNVMMITSLAAFNIDDLQAVWEAFYRKYARNPFSIKRMTKMPQLYFQLAGNYARDCVLLEMVRDEISMRQAPSVTARRGHDHVNITNVVNVGP